MTIERDRLARAVSRCDQHVLRMLRKQSEAQAAVQKAQAECRAANRALAAYDRDVQIVECGGCAPAAVTA